MKASAWGAWAGAAGGGTGEDLEQDLGDDAERAFGADEQLGEVEGLEEKFE